VYPDNRVPLAEVLAVFGWDAARLEIAQRNRFPTVYERTAEQDDVLRRVRYVLAHELGAWVDRVRELAPQFAPDAAREAV
jgi:hypothetical protein